MGTTDCSITCYVESFLIQKETRQLLWNIQKVHFFSIRAGKMGIMLIEHEFLVQLQTVTPSKYKCLSASAWHFYQLLQSPLWGTGSQPFMSFFNAAGNAGALYSSHKWGCVTKASGDLNFRNYCKQNTEDSLLLSGQEGILCAKFPGVLSILIPSSWSPCLGKSTLISHPPFGIW